MSNMLKLKVGLNAQTGI